jgi:hypothetical protein
MSDKQQRKMFNQMIVGSKAKGGKSSRKRSSSAAEGVGSKKHAKKSKVLEDFRSDEDPMSNLPENVSPKNTPDLGSSERLPVEGEGSKRNVPVEGGGSRSNPVNVEDIRDRSTTPVVNIDPIPKPIDYDILSMLNIEILC